MSGKAVLAGLSDLAWICVLQHKLICETNCGHVDDMLMGRLPGGGLLCVWDTHNMPLELDKWMANYTSKGGSAFIHLLCFQAVIDCCEQSLLGGVQLLSLTWGFYWWQLHKDQLVLLSGVFHRGEWRKGNVKVYFGSEVIYNRLSKHGGDILLLESLGLTALAVGDVICSHACTHCSQGNEQPGHDDESFCSPACS